MEISINLPFEELLTIIKNLKPTEKSVVAQLLIKETEVAEQQWELAMKRKEDFEEGKIDIESWSDLKKRILN